LLLINCYHGTTSSRAESILKNGFKASTAPRMWLGTGVYFFQEGFDLCCEWARKSCKRPNAKATDTPVVLHAQINMEHGIDLIANRNWPTLRNIYKANYVNLKSLKQNGIDTLVRPMTVAEKKLDFDHPLDHVLIDRLVDAETTARAYNGFPGPTLVRAAFVEGETVDPRSWLFDRAAVIVSVVDRSCILSVTPIKC